MSAHALLNLLNKLKKSDKMQGLPRILSLFRNKFVCLILFFTSHQQSFRYIGTGLPGLNQY